MAIRSLEERIAARVFDIRKSDKSKSIGTVKKEIMKEFPDASRNEINNGFNLASKQLQKFGKEQKQIKKKTDNETEIAAMKIVNQIVGDKSNTNPIEEEPNSNDEFIEENNKIENKPINGANSDIVITNRNVVTKEIINVTAKYGKYTIEIHSEDDKDKHGVITRCDGLVIYNKTQLDDICREQMEEIERKAQIQKNSVLLGRDEAVKVLKKMEELINE